MHESEVASLCQRRKVEELEAQLHEAEDVITDLRIQLKEALYDLEKEKKDKMQPFKGKIMNKITLSSKSTLEPDTSSPSSSEMQTVSSNLRNTKIKQIAHATDDSVPKSGKRSPVSPEDIVYSHDSDSTSTEARTKERELCSKRCTQRTRSSRRNFLDYRLPLGIDVQRRQVLEENEPTITGKTDTGKNVHGAVLKRSVKLHTLRRASQFEKCKTGSCRLHGSQFMKPHHPSCVVSLCKPYLKDGNVRSGKNGYTPPSLMADSGNVTQNSCLSEEYNVDSYKDVNGNSYGGQLKGNMKGGNLNGHSPDQSIKPCDKSFVLSPCNASINLDNDSGRSGEGHSNVTKHQRKMKQLTCLDPGLTSTRSYVDPTSVSTSVTASTKVNRSRIFQNAANSKREMMALSVKQESGEIRNLIFPSSELNSEMNTNTKYEQICEVTNCSPCLVDEKMSLKCTIQSKRKREATSISDENISPGKSKGKRRLREKLKCEPELKRSNLTRESSSERRQLSQVARQVC